MFRNPRARRDLERIAAKGHRLRSTAGARAGMADVVRHPCTTRSARPVPAGLMSARTCAPTRSATSARRRSPTAATTSTAWRRRPEAARPSARRSTSSSATDLSFGDDRQALHHYLEASALAFADRGTYVGDPAYVDVPTSDLLTTLSPTSGPARSTRPRRLTSRRGRRPDSMTASRLRDGGGTPSRDREHLHDPPHGRRQVGQRRGLHPDHRADRRHGPGRARPRLPAQQRATDFRPSTTPTTRTCPARQAPAQLDVADDRAQGRQAVLALGSPGGSTIITTVLQILVNRIDLGMSPPRRSRRRGPPSATPPRRRPSRSSSGAHGPALCARPHARAAGDAVHLGCGDRRGDGDRVRPAAVCSPQQRSRRARWRHGPCRRSTCRRARPATCRLMSLPLPQGSRHGERLRGAARPGRLGPRRPRRRTGRALCDRRSGVGADGVLRAGREAPWFMDYRNPDGSVSEMCGNGIRVFARYLVDAGAPLPMEIDTRDGVKEVHRRRRGPRRHGIARGPGERR